ncbi:piggyBac transposable element-derived protein 3-like [Aphis craccivora]|uniref:PiggyBac transposable element-derived protein 3-like n=1 Tax=Aphis craccivora TaxID=307492 RepID=A0A6G0YBA7_APHCR|nr:piggyBac transposable element-derived protein 3-like [Aphis craccivora]
MGGVDILDQLISCYRILIRSRKWIFSMAMHEFDIAIINSWIQYNKEAEQINLAKDLIIFEKPISPKR